MLKQPNFFYSHPSSLPKDAPAKFYLSKTFGLSFMVSSVTPTRSSTFYAYLITKIGNRNLNVPVNPILPGLLKTRWTWGGRGRFRPLFTLLVLIVEA